jgi:hypothetical protein
MDATKTEIVTKVDRYSLKLPVEVSSKTVNRIGINDETFAHLSSLQWKAKRNESFVDKLLDTKDFTLAKRNEYAKEREYKDDEQNRLDYRYMTHVKVSHVTNDPSIQYDEMFPLSWRDLEDKVTGLLLFATIHVVRTIFEAENNVFYIHVDQAIFEDRDPHLVCSIRNYHNVPEELRMYLKLKQDPVRSIICEYMFRYNITLYYDLLDLNFIPDLDYSSSFLTSQWTKLNDEANESPEPLFKAIARAEGRLNTPVAM